MEPFEMGGAWLSGVGLLDGVPENMALGVSLLQGAGTLTLLVAVFASNLPEALGGAFGMRDSGRAKTSVISVWKITAVALTLSLVAGNAVLASAGDGPLAVLLAFADTLVPDAYREGGGLVAFATVAGCSLVHGGANVMPAEGRRPRVV